MNRRLLVLLLCHLSIQGAYAQLPTARLLTVFPPGARAGSTTEVAITGMDLDEAAGIIFSHQGITSQPKLNQQTQLQEPDKFLVTINAEVPPGTYEARVTGRYGFTNPRRFTIGTRPELVESDNNSFAKAMALPLSATVNGRTEAQAIDFYKFTAQKGQRLFVLCEASEIDSRSQPSMVLLDSAGRELQRSRRGELLDFTAPTDGDYVIKLHDFLYLGGSEFFYRLTLTDGLCADYLLPHAANPGTAARFTVFGKNLPSVGKEVTLEIPSSAAPFPLSPNAATLDGFQYRWNDSNPLFVGLTPCPVAVESTQSVQRVEVPCDISGQFYPAGDVDTYAFEAQKDEVFWIEVISQRLGLPTDPLLVVQRVKDGQEVLELADMDTNLGGAEFKTSSLDASGKFEAKEAGEYRVRVRDMFNVRDNPANVYRLNIRKADPDFELLAFAQPPQSTKKDVKEAMVWPAFARRGETIPLKVLALRERGFNGDINLSIAGLPAGITSPGGRIAAGQNSTVLLLTAAESVSNWFGNIVVQSKERSKIARSAVLTWPAADLAKEAVHSRLTSNLTLGVCGDESTPVTIEATQPSFSAPRAGKIAMPLKITRRGDFKETFKMKAYGHAQLDSLKEIEITDKTNLVTLEIDLGQHKLSEGDHHFYLMGQTKGKFTANPDKPARLEELVKAAGTNQLRKDALATLAKQAVERAKPKEATITVYSAPISLKVTPVQTARADQ